MPTERRRRERGITIPFIAIASVGLMAFTGLVVDGANAFAQRRQMQNSADAAALAGASELNDYMLARANGTSFDVTSIDDVVRDSAEENGAERAGVVCQLSDGASTQACPTDANGLAVPAAAYIVRATVDQTYETTFIQVVGQAEFDAGATADAAVLALSSGDAPFLVCAVEGQDYTSADPAQFVPLLVPPASGGGASLRDWVINPAALGRTYWVKGVEVKKNCGTNGQFKGLVDDTAGPYSIPGSWLHQTGNHAGPVRVQLRSNDGCEDETSSNCILLLPLCFAEAPFYCVGMAQFRVLGNDANSAWGIFEGGAPVVTDGEGTGPPVDGLARVIRLIR